MHKQKLVSDHYVGRRALRWIALLLVSAVALGTSAPPQVLAIPLAPILHLDAPPQVVVGETIELTLTVMNAADLAGYETVLRFDPTAAHFNGLQQRHNGIKKFGRDVSPLGAVELPYGISFGLYSCPVADCLSETTGHGSGARGNVKLATIAIVPDEPGQLELVLDGSKFVDAMGEPVLVAVPDPSLVIEVGPVGVGPLHSAPPVSAIIGSGGGMARLPVDLTGDGRVSHADAMEVAIGWMQARERDVACGSLPDRSRDLNQDGCLDVADLQLVTAHYGPVPGAPMTADEPPSLSGGTEPGIGSIAPLAANEATFTVNATTDDADVAIGNGACATAKGVCTLRAALAEANARSGPETVAFNIAGPGVRTIQLARQLPIIGDATGAITIDGYTQPGATPNTNALNSNAAIKVQIAGTGTASFSALFITSSGNTVRGLAFYNLGRGVTVYGSGATGNRIVGNIVGTNVAASFFATETAPGMSGIVLQQGAHHNLIGDTAPADRNIVSGNAHQGVATYDETTDYNVIVNNIIGLDPAATKSVPNRNHGIDINTHSSYNQIGGTAPGQRNVVSGNGIEGIEISHGTGTIGNQIIGNFIGTDVSGNRAPSFSHNVDVGVLIEDGVRQTLVADNIIGGNNQGGIRIDGAQTTGTEVRNNRIGIAANNAAIPNVAWGVELTKGVNQTTIGPGNLIAYQPVGIQLTDSAGNANRITANAIFSNTLLGIDLDPLGAVNPNDADDTDNGPNTGLNFPVITAATPTRVSGTACVTCTVEVFVADLGAGAHGQGKALAGVGSVNSDGSWTIAVQGVMVGSYVTATAIDANGNTSEFGLNMLVSKDPPATATPIPTAVMTRSPTNTMMPTATPKGTPIATPTATATHLPTPTLSDTLAPTTTATGGPTGTAALTPHQLYFPLVGTTP